MLCPTPWLKNASLVAQVMLALVGVVLATTLIDACLGRLR